jgi:hypothetical protein
MALDFPSNPTVGQEYIYASKVWVWTGGVWNSWNTADFPSLSSSTDWDSTYTTVSANSASWIGGESYDDSLLQTTSGYWDSTYTTVSANSASWVGGSAYDDSLLQTTSGYWDSTYTTVSANSASWVGGVDYDDSLLQTTSGYWDSTYTTVSANSASWAGSGPTTSPVVETSIYIDAAAMKALDSGASASTGSDAGTNNSIDWWNVDVTEELFAKVAMPPQWDGGDVDVEFFWTINGASAGDNVRWAAAATCGGDGDLWDSAFSTVTETADDLLIADDTIHVVKATGITPAGTPADGDILSLKIQRTATAGQTASVDARLLGVRVHYQNNVLRNWYINKMGTETADADATVAEKEALVAPGDGIIYGVHSGVSSATAGAGLTVDVKINGTSILSTLGIVADGETTSDDGASTSHVLTTDPTTFSKGDRISFEISSFGGTGGKGLHTDLLISWTQ